MAAWLLNSFALWFSETMPNPFPLGCGFTFSGCLMVPGPDVTLSPAVHGTRRVAAAQHGGDLHQGTSLAQSSPSNAGSKHLGGLKARF